MNKTTINNSAAGKTAANIISIDPTLTKLRKTVDPELIRKRETRQASGGAVRTIEYVEWHTVADILDEAAPSWQHSIRDIREIGDLLAVTVAITIDGITREGIGTGSALTEMGIKKAEHDALKRAAVKFGIARDLYRHEFDTKDSVEEPDTSARVTGFPSDPVASMLSDLVTPKQLSMIRGLAKNAGIDADKECKLLMNCRTDELSKRAASALIAHLQAAEERSRLAPAIRKAG